MSELITKFIDQKLLNEFNDYCIEEHEYTIDGAITFPSHKYRKCAKILGMNYAIMGKGIRKNFRQICISSSMGLCSNGQTDMLLDILICHSVKIKN
jgi:hypothetical protein